MLDSKLLLPLLLTTLGHLPDGDASPHLGPHLGPPLSPLGPPLFGMMRYPSLGYPPGPSHSELNPDLAPPPAPNPPEPPPPPPPPRHGPSLGPPGLVMPSLRPMQWTSLLGYHRPMDAMVDVTNELGVSVLQDYSYSRGNFAFSPYGVASVLVVLYEGARGETARQVHNTLKLPWERDVTRVGFRDIHRNLRRYFSHEGYLSGVTLSQSRTALLPEFRRVLRFYGYDVDQPPEGFNNTDTLDKDKPLVTFTSHQNSNRTNSSSPNIAPGSNIPATEPSTTTATVNSTPLEAPRETTTAATSKVTSESTSKATSESTSKATSESTSKATSESTSESKTETTSEATSSMAPSTAMATAITQASNSEPTETGADSTTSTDSNPLGPLSTTEQPSSPSEGTSTSTTGSSASTSSTAPEETDTAAESVPDSENEEDRPSASLTESKTNSPVSNPQENEVSGDELNSEEGIQSRIDEDPEPEPELTTTVSTPETEPTTTTMTSELLDSVTESSTFAQGETPAQDADPEPEVEPSTTEEYDYMTEAPSTQTPSPSNEEAPTTSIPQRRSAGPGPALSFWTGLEAALARNDSARNRRDINDLSLQLQNGMFDSHVAVGDELFKQLARQPFLVDGSFEEPVPVMEYTATFPFAYLPRLHALAMEFPLDDERYKLLLLLPVERERHALHHLLLGLSHVTLREVQRALRPRRLHAVVPAFMVEGFVILTPTLQQLGIWDMFDPRRADLSGMTDDPNLYVRNIEQAVTVVIKNYVEILDIQTRTTAARSHLDQFIATHPFLYFVMDSETQVALMAGKVVDPLNSRIY